MSPYYPSVYKKYRGKDAGEKLLKNLMMEGANLTKKIKNANAPMKYEENEKQAFMQATESVSYTHLTLPTMIRV